MILYEHKHLRSDDKKASITFLKNDYHIFDFGNDFFSIKKGVINSFDIFKLRTKLIH